MLTRVISSVEGHIEEFLIDCLWPKDLLAKVRKSAGTRHLVVEYGLVNLALQVMGHGENDFTQVSDMKIRL